MADKKVVLGITHKGKIISEIAEFLFQARLPKGYSRFTLESKGETAGARNKLVELALDRDDVEWFVLLKEDQAPNPRDLKYLIGEAEKRNIKVLTPISYTYHFKFPIPILHDIHKDVHFDRIIASGFYKMEEIPTKSVLIHRSVFDNIDKPWFKRSTNEAAVVDSFFSEKCKKAGFQPYLTEDVVVDNFQEIDLEDYHDALDLVIKADRDEICEELHNMIWSGEEQAAIK